MNNRPLIKLHISKFLAFESEEDLMQEAYFCLVKAVEKYDPNMNILFMTYCGKCIDSGIRRYLENNGSVLRIPSYMKAKIYHYNRIVTEYERDFGRIPTKKEIAEIAGFSNDEIADIKKYSQKLSSLDKPLLDDDSITLQETIKADFSLEDSVLDEIIDANKKNEIWGVVERFTDARENDVIQKYFLYNQTMPEIAKEMGISHQRVRDIKESGLRKMKRPKAKRILQEQYELYDYDNYRCGLQNFKETFSSKVEYIVLKRDEIEREYRERLNKLLAID